MKIKPLDDNVVIKQVKADEKTSGGIILPDTAKEKPQIGKVVSTGPGKALDSGERKKVSLKTNDKVIYAKYIGSDVEIDGEKYIILKESDILGVVED